MTDAFKEISLSRGSFTATWEYIGEGWSGDYNPDDPQDTELLRFSVYQHGEQMDDGSYCTRMPIDSPEWMLRRALDVILNAVETTDSPKRRLELLSWLQPADFTEDDSRDPVTKGEK
jgi:hypothetical protein